MKKSKKKTKKRVAKKGELKRYKELWGFIKTSGNFFYIILGIFIVTLALGFVFPGLFADVFNEMIREILAKTKDLDFGQLLAFILYNNIKTSFLGLILGVIFGLFPLFLAALNGYLLGYVANMVYVENGVGSLWKILPHGVFELPAFFLSLALGLRLGYTLFLKSKDFKKTLKLCLQTFFYVIIPLLLIAGFIETSLIFLLK
jgi:stage II sporulation protein M